MVRDMPGRRPSRAPSGRGRRRRRRLYGRAGACTRLRFAMTRRRRGYKDAGSLTAEEGAAGRAHAARHAAREVLEVVGPREADETAVGGARTRGRVLVQRCCLARWLGRVWHRFPRCSVGRHRLRCMWRRAIAVAASKRFKGSGGTPRCDHLFRFALIRAFGLVHSRKDDMSGSDSKLGTLLSRVATYPPGARRRAGASGDRAIVTAVRDGPPRSQTILRRRQRRIAQEPCP